MSGTQGTKYTLQDQKEIERFVLNVIDSEAKPGMVLDSTTATTAALDAIAGAPGEKPRVLDELFGVASTKEDVLMKALFDGVNHYKREHGTAPRGDLMLSALDQGKSIFDSATNSHHDQISLTPNAPVVAILGALAEATPFAGYLPADRGSNEARLIIVQHNAGSAWGDYNLNDLMDGIAQGGAYLQSSRSIDLAAPNDTLAYEFTFKAQNAPAGVGTGNALNLLRGRTMISVNGLLAAQEIGNGPSLAASVGIVGSIVLAGVTYQLAGTVQPNLGIVTVTPTPALPAGTVMTCEAFVDYEQDATVTPRIAVQAQVFQMFASPYRALYQVTPEARSQFANEVGVDAGAEAMLAVRGQFAMERHYNALAKMRMVGAYNNTATYDFQYSEQIQQKTRAQIWQDFASIIGTVSQKMAEDTADHGVTHLYVGKFVAAQFRSMDATLFTPSGITDRPGIYRVGRLFGMYEVYYSPKVVIEDPAGVSSEILCIGRSTQTGRCPAIFGDASAPMFEQLGLGTDLRSGYGFNARSFTNVNPHLMSAKGAALITVLNLK